MRPVSCVCCGLVLVGVLSGGLVLGGTGTFTDDDFILIADSSADFSGVQGRNNWYYGYYNVSTDPNGFYNATPGGTDDFQAFTWYGVDTNHSDEPAWQFNTTDQPWTLLSAGKAHPNGSDQWSGGSTNVHWAVRRWVSEGSGHATINWFLSKAAVGGNPWSNGVTARLFHNGAQVDSRTIAWNATTNLGSQWVTLDVQAGDYIDFALDATGTFSSLYGGYGNGQWDMSNFSAHVVLMPEPATLGLLAVGGLLTLRRRR